MPRKQRPKEENPFISGLTYPTKWLLNTQRGFDSQPIDIEPHVKVYEKLASILPSMTTGELQLLHTILKKYPTAKIDGLTQDYMELNHKTAEMSESTFHRAKNGLTALNIITRRMERQGTYWINPAMVFRGNRVVNYPKCGVAVNEDPLRTIKERFKQEVIDENEE